ncbi:hypothetical protein QTP86_001921 [Hemibagrus guttatus]|nr:hypothetical protein QTP86_001921 [Hemibagrus guttatus]
MAAVYSEKRTRLRINVANVLSENVKDSSPENRADSPSGDKRSSEENSSVGCAVRAGSPAPEAQQHAEVAALSAAAPPIRIKEEPVEESEYLTVHVDDVVEENWEQPGRGAHFSGRDERADGDWPFCCEEKSTVFGNKEAYTEHRREHTHDGPIVCLDTDSQWDNLLVSTDGGHQTLCCALCGCKFSNSREFFTHQLKHRNDLIKQESILETGEGLSKQKIFECNDCGKTYSSIGQCLNHQRSHKQASKSVFHQLAHLKKKSFQCPTCGRSYSRASALDAHRRCHEEKLFKSKNSEGEKYLTEEVTVKAEDTADTSSEQLDESPKKRFECLDCGKSFRTMCGLGTHQRFSVNCSSTAVKVRVKRSFDCTECGKTFHRPMAMACHQRWHKRREQLHGNDQPFQCKECGKVFTSLTFYNKHQRLAHSKEMPAKSFLHQVFQLQKKAFECQECGRRFSRASALHSHQLCHTDVFGDIMEGSSQKSPMEQTVVSYQNNQDKTACFAEASVYSQNIMQTNVGTLVGTFSKKGYKADNDFKPVVIEASGSQRRDHGSHQNPDLELVCESDQEEKDLNPCKESVLSSQKSDTEMDVNIVQIDSANFNEGFGNTEMEQSPSQEAKKYECSECNRTFDKAVSLRCHMLWHRGGMGKKSRYRRKMHIGNPIRKASIKCEICGHESFTKASHYVHLGKHEDRTPYKSIMYQLANLQKNSFKCDVCGMHFSRLSALQSHQQHHNKRKKPYECLQCDKSYSNLSTLYNHQKVCTGKEPINSGSPSDKDRKAEQFNPSVLAIQAKELNLCFIRPENFASHGLGVLQVPFGKLQFGRGPALGRVLVVPNFFHLRMMEANVLIGTFNDAEIFLYPSPDLCLDKILSLRSTDNSLEFMAWAHRLSAHLGEHHVFIDEATEQRIWVEKVIPHPDYNDRTYDNDFMLIKLLQPAVFNQYVQPIPLASSCTVAGEECLVSGWGNQINTGVIYASVLQCLNLPVLSHSKCEGAYGSRVTNNMFCAGYLEGGKDSCQGDSGGPVVCNGELKGVVSWGDGCALPGFPGVYAEVCRYTDWVNSIMATN